MAKSTVKVNIHTGCLGCEREEKPIMLSLDGNNSQGTYVFLDAFLTETEAEDLIQELQSVINTFKDIKWTSHYSATY